MNKWKGKNIINMDKRGRIWLPKEIREKLDTNSFIMETKEEDGRLIIILKPIKKLLAKLPDGTLIEIVN